ncbi:MAG TPA: glycosyltransferase [Planctomycetota bacterium]|nr:glycosyltransferase [Planctomycetota bacterium]
MFTRETPAEALITVVTRNRLEYTARCLAALEAMDEPAAVHVVIVDNGSDRATIDWLKLWTYNTGLTVRRLVLLSPRDPHNIAAAVNLGWLQSHRYPIRVKLDNDILLPRDWLARTRRLIYAGYGLVGWVPCDEPDLARGFLPVWQTIWNSTFRGYHYVFGGCACASERWFEKVGYWHEGYRRGIDFEYSIRGQLLGEMITYVKDACAVHVGTESADDDFLRRQAYQEARLRFDLTFSRTPQPYMTRWLTRRFSQNRFVWQVAE